MTLGEVLLETRMGKTKFLDWLRKEGSHLNVVLLTAARCGSGQRLTTG